MHDVPTNRRDFLHGLALVPAAGLVHAPAVPAPPPPIPPFVNVTEYGVAYDSDETGSGGSVSASANTTALNTLINSLPASGALLFFPAGFYRFAGNINVTNRSITIAGAGVQQSILVWTSSGGIVGSFSSRYLHRFYMRDVTLSTMTAGGSTAVTRAWPGAPNSGSTVGETAGAITRVEIRTAGHEIGGRYWNTGIKLQGAWFFTISEVTIHGDPGGMQGSTTGVFLNYGVGGDGEEGRCGSVGCKMINCDFTGLNIGVWLQDDPQGFDVSTSGFVGCNYGLNIEPVNPAAEFSVMGCHFACKVIGVYAQTHAKRVFVQSHCSFYNGGNGTWKGVISRLALRNPVKVVASRSTVRIASFRTTSSPGSGRVRRSQYTRQTAA